MAMARQQQSDRENRRLAAHARVAEQLRAGYGVEPVVASAREQIEKWQQGALCSRDYIDAWQNVLAEGPARIAEVLEDPLMRLEDIHLILTEAKKISRHSEFVIAGSLSVLGLPVDVPDLMSHSIDIDYYPLRDPGRADVVTALLGEGRPFHQQNGYYLDPISPALPTLPRTWRERVVRHDFGDVTAIFLDVNDTAISKYVRGAENDFRWIEVGYDAGLIDINTIRAHALSGAHF
ncbi:hypothetical protein DFQ28_009276 [Apophysomyces sp. BC1034]|nr:hypothetical protein DFQ28_009276 [Apophysomyces sp. BC1034]